MTRNEWIGGGLALLAILSLVLAGWRPLVLGLFGN